MTTEVKIVAVGHKRSGKSVVLNILAHALEEAGIEVVRTRHVPKLDTSKLTLEEPLKVTLVEEGHEI